MSSSPESLSLPEEIKESSHGTSTVEGSVKPFDMEQINSLRENIRIKINDLRQESLGKISATDLERLEEETIGHATRKFLLEKGFTLDSEEYATFYDFLYRYNPVAVPATKWSDGDARESVGEDKYAIAQRELEELTVVKDDESDLDEPVDDEPIPDAVDTDPIRRLLETMVLTDTERTELEDFQELYVGLKMRGRRRVTRRGDKKLRQAQMLLESKKHEILKRIAADNMAADATEISPDLKQALLQVSLGMLSDQTAKELETYKQFVDGKGVRKRFLRWYSKKGLLAKIGIGVAGGAVISGVAALGAILTPFAVAGVGAGVAVGSGLRFARGYVLKDERHFKLDTGALTNENVLHADIKSEYEKQLNAIGSVERDEVLKSIHFAGRAIERSQMERDRRRNRVGLAFAIGSVAAGTAGGWALSQYMQGNSLTEIPREAWGKLTGGNVAELHTPSWVAAHIDTSDLQVAPKPSAVEAALPQTTPPEAPAHSHNGVPEHLMNKTEQRQYISELREEGKLKHLGTLGREVQTHGGVTETKVFYGDTPIERTEIALHKLGLKVEDRDQLREIMRAVKASEHIKFVAGPGPDGVQPEVGIDVKTPSNAIAFKDASSARHFAEVAMKHGAYNEKYVDMLSVKSGIVETFAGHSVPRIPEFPNFDSSPGALVPESSASVPPVMDVNAAFQNDGFAVSGGSSEAIVHESVSGPRVYDGLSARESMIVDSAHGQNIKVNTAHGAEGVVGKVLRANGINPTNRDIQATITELGKTNKSYFKDLGLEAPFGGRDLIGYDKRVRVSQEDARELIKAFFTRH